MMGSRSDTSVEKLFTTALYPLQVARCQVTTFPSCLKHLIKPSALYMTFHLPCTMIHVCGASEIST